MNPSGTRRPRLALPFTVIAQGDTVHLVAGEDFRYTLTGPALERWLPALLGALEGRQTLDQLLEQLDRVHHAAAREIISRLYGERILVDGTPSDRHAAAAYRPSVEGSDALAAVLSHELDSQATDHRPLPILFQDRLDYEAALQFNRRCLADTAPWLWVSTGAMSRGYVSPVFLPGAGPCLGCLLRQFQRLSPAPEIYDALRAHARRGQPIAPVPFPAEGIAILHQLVLGKLAWLRQHDPPSALYRLHVLEVEALEVTAHRVLPDPRCPDCGEAN